MFDFGKMDSSGGQNKETHPIKIYDTLDRLSDAGPLRDAQKEILDQWNDSYRKSKDVILKLHTGQGKTLIGLLTLKALLAENHGKAIYLCPNKQLVEQTCRQAKKFGIDYCTFTDEKVLPHDFLENGTILITHVQKYFNGLSKFGIGSSSIPIDYFVIDDSHACITEISKSFQINVNYKHGVYSKFLLLFEEDLRDQGKGTFSDILNNDFNAFLPVPYWAWVDKENEIIEILSEFRDDLNILFAWTLIRDHIQNCECIISGHYLEIRPYYNPMDNYQGFSKARHRMFMSASTLDDSYLVKGLGISKETLENPLFYKKETWSGEKMLLIPELIDHSLDRVNVINYIAPENKSRLIGVISLVPSNWHSNIWKDCGAEVITSENAIRTIEKIRNGDHFKVKVFVNRYDGIDLADDQCRVLIMDSKPFATSLFDLYEEQCRQDSEIVHLKMAQKIEQGLGRSVRGEKDYSVIMIIGADLINAIRNSKTKSYFSSQTNLQIEMGIEIARQVKNQYDSDTPMIKILNDIVSKSINRASDWKQFYVNTMNGANLDNSPRNRLIDQLIEERNAEELSYSGRFEEAVSKLQNLVDSHISKNEEKGWYLQVMARMQYFQSKSKANQLQVNAHRANRILLRPKTGMIFEKLEFLNQNRLQNILSIMKGYESYDDLILDVNDVLDKLSFGIKAKDFENAVERVGTFLGFISQQPERDWKEGSDNLWCVKDNEFFLIECKSEVAENRDRIDKKETGQMNNSIAWFESKYRTEGVTRIMIVPTRKIAPGAGFIKDVHILRKKGLNALKRNLRNFFSQYSDIDLSTVTLESINEQINHNLLRVKDFKDHYLEEPYLQKSY